MKRRTTAGLGMVLAMIATLAGCTHPPPAGTITLQLECPASKAEIPNADYIGRYAGVENVIPLKDMAQDIHCSDAFKAAYFPKGFVTIYGSSRIRENDPVYAQVRSFASSWTQRHGGSHPIMTGAGPGLMEAGNRGAREASGPSVGYTTYYDRTATGSAARPYGGDAKLALNPFVTHGLIFSSVAIREHAMIKHSAAMVIAPGGTGTEWELFQIVETLKSNQLAKVPVYLVGNRRIHWQSLEARLADMVKRKTLGKDEIAFLKFADDGEALMKQLAADLGLN